MEALTEELQGDIYVRKIDLRHNKITETQILGPFVESMLINESLLNIDFSFNTGHTEAVKQKIALCLLKNKEIVKSSGVPIRASWINLKQIEVLDEHLNAFTKGFSFVEDSFLSKDANQEIKLLSQV